MNLNPLKLKDITISIEEVNNEVKIYFDGIIQFRDPNKKIQPYLTRQIDFIINKKAKTLIINFNKLTFVNSSGIALLIKWIMDINQIYVDKNKSTLIILYNNSILWQEFVFEVMKKQFPDIILINSENNKN